MHTSIVFVGVAVPLIAVSSDVSWDVVNLDAVSGSHLHDDGVWSPGTTNSFEECQSLCAQNSSCVACDWAGDVDIGDGNCHWKTICYFRSDKYWAPHKNGKCNHTAARKVGGPVPPTPPSPPSPPSPQCGKPCQDDTDCDDSTCSWCSSVHGNQTCTGPPDPSDCGSVPEPNTTSKLQFASWGDSVSKGLFHGLATLLSDYEAFHPSGGVGGGCGNIVRGKYCTDLWLYGPGGQEKPARKWDLVTFNFGLHDLAQDSEFVPVHKYQRNLRNVSSALLDATSAGRLFWLSTTPVPNVPLSPPRTQSDVAIYNAAAKEVMDELSIPVIDVYSFVIEQCGGDEHYTSCPKFQREKNVHFEPAGYDAMARFIYSSIESVISV